MKCEKCNREMKLILIENGEFLVTEIWRCSNLRCGHMFRIVKSKK